MSLKDEKQPENLTNRWVYHYREGLGRVLKHLPIPHMVLLHIPWGQSPRETWVADWDIDEVKPLDYDPMNESIIGNKMKLSIKKIANLIKEELKLIREQGEDDEGTKKAPTEAPEEPAEEEPEEPAEKEIELEPEDMFAVGKEIDNSLEAVLQDYETRALKSAALDNQVTERKKMSLLIILESPDSSAPKIDIHQFASDVARLIKNYQYLLDIEAVIFNKAEDYLLDKYGELIATDFVDVMQSEHGLDFGKGKIEKEQHYAVTGTPGNSDVGMSSPGE